MNNPDNDAVPNNTDRASTQMVDMGVQTDKVDHTGLLSLSSRSPPSPHRYVVFMETNDEECESWYTFIRYDGNEERIRELAKMLEEVQNEEVDEDEHIFFFGERKAKKSFFDMDINHLVSEQTAREMCTIALNYGFYHRKFDGKLRKIEVGDDTEYKKRSSVIYNMLCLGQIENFIDEEELN